MEKIFRLLQAEANLSQRPRTILRELVEVLLFAFVFLIFVNTFVWQNFKIPTESMENSLLVGDHLTANIFVFNGSRWESKLFPFRGVKRGDVVVFRSPDLDQLTYIKRCVGLPGDSFFIRNDRLYVNGQPLDEAYAWYKDFGMDRRDPDNGYRPIGYNQLEPGLDNARLRWNENSTIQEILKRTEATLAPYRYRNEKQWNRVSSRLQTGEDGVIPHGFYLMMGDNRNFSSDSRSWGLVPEEMIKGRAWFVWWSYGEEMNTHQATGLQRLKLYAQVIITFWTRTHIDESLRLIK